MSHLYLIIVAELFFLGLAVLNAPAAISEEDPPSVSDFDKGFMTDRLLEEDLRRDSDFWKERFDRDRGESLREREQG